MKKNGGFFQLENHQTTIKQEIFAGITGYFTIVYIVIVNAMILSEAGIPFAGAVIATIIASFFGCLLMAFWANAPILLVPGMGINAMFTFTLVQGMGLSWQQALTVIVVSGLIFTMIAFSNLAKLINEAIPAILKEAISVGLGFFIMFIGLEKGGLVIRGENSLIQLGNLLDPYTFTTIITFIITVILFVKQVKGSFLWSILSGTVIAYFFNTLPDRDQQTISLFDYQDVFGHLSFHGILHFPFWIAVFSMTMVLVFENIGLVQGHVQFLKQPEKDKKMLQATALSTLFSGVFGTSPTVATVESTASIAAGGRTGLTALTTGLLFLGSLIFIPYMRWIPDSAIAPILILIGVLMIQNIRHMKLDDFSEGLPAILLMTMIPFTYSIADGIAIGFIAYPLVKLIVGKGKDVSFVLYMIAGLFFLYFLFQNS